MRYALNEVALNGWMTWYGSSAVSMVMNTTGNAIKADLATASATMAMQAAGSTASVDLGTGSATMAMAAAGASANVDLATGAATMAMQAAAGNTVVELASGYAEMAMTASAGIPAPGTVSQHAGPAHPSCQVVVGAEDAAMRIEPDAKAMVDRTITRIVVAPEPEASVAPEQNTLIIEPDWTAA